MVGHDQLESGGYFFTRILGTPLCGTHSEFGIGLVFRPPENVSLT